MAHIPLPTAARPCKAAGQTDIDVANPHKALIHGAFSSRPWAPLPSPIEVVNIRRRCGRGNRVD